jgi:TrmH family RNA methyltransferase
MKKNRVAENLFVVEGVKIVEEVIAEHPDLIELIVTSDGSLVSHEKAFSIEETDMKKISQFKTASSMLAVVRIPRIKPINTSLVLAIDGVQDPGNMGTIIRTADWFGVDHIVCSKDTVDAYTPKVAQSSMGSIFRTSIEYADLTTRLTEFNKPIYGALLSGDNLYSSELSEEAVLVVGNEGKGISSEVEALVTDPILIPKKGQAESLNVAIATGILLAEFSK